VHASVSVTNLHAAWREWDHASVHWFNGGYSTIELYIVLCYRKSVQETISGKSNWVLFDSIGIYNYGKRSNMRY